MKKLILLVSFALIASVGSAQQLGIKAGATYASFKGDDAKNFNYRFGYTAGLMLQQHITEIIGVQVEALYTSKGAVLEYQASGNNIEDKYRLNYVDVPVLLHLSQGGLFIDLGPQVSFIAKARRITDTTPNNSSTTVTVKREITDDPYQIDLGYAAGLGFRATNGLGLELRYNGGLKKIGDENTLENRQVRNSTFYLMASYLLGGR
ncbi:porin family protein [Pontibacter ruber]|uniref:Porin family protein n=1 Tax=Pontibacter ruber TaxID=1343895 RepID=A0ABW5CVA1_9BACT|nr:porin family protein [Pontibacter ruber]